MTSPSKTKLFSAIFQKGSPVREIADAVMAKEHDPDQIGFLFERALVRDIVYREEKLEPVIRDLYNFGQEVVQSDYGQTVFDYTKNLQEQAKVFGIMNESLLKVLEVMKRHTPYDNAVQALKRELSYTLIDYHPKNDGVDHINVYSKGKTKLGKLLSNFAHTPFVHPTNGHFASIEAYWYWLLFNKQDNDIRGLFGYKAKQYGMAARAKAQSSLRNSDTGSFRTEIKEAMLYKVQQNKELRVLLEESTLPLVHYYCWGDAESSYRITFPKRFIWVTDYLELLRCYLKGSAYRTLIAGETENSHLFYTEDAVARFDIKTVQFIGMEGTPVNAARYLSEKLEIPYYEVMLEKDKYGRVASLRQNSVAVDLCTAAVVVVKPTNNSIISDLCEKIDRDADVVCFRIHDTPVEKTENGKIY